MGSCLCASGCTVPDIVVRIGWFGGCRGVGIKGAWPSFSCFLEVPGPVPLVGGERERTLEAIEACWIAVSIDGEKPPETSVPRPT